MKIYDSALLVFSVLNFLCQTASASPVYRWEDAQGVLHYSSKPLSAAAKPADLPPIMRAEVKVSKQALTTCNDHGGVNCQSGADKDGSVICYDGFKGAAARYRFSCNSPKLEIADISELNKEGGFTVFVRNKTSVTASNPALFFKPDNGRESKLEGPADIGPFGMAEFVFKPIAPELALLVTANHVQLNLTCANCP